MKISVTALWIFHLFLFTSFSAECGNPIEEAWNAIDKKNFSLAQKILSNQLKIQPHDTPTQFLYARSLAWGGKFSEAITTLDRLIISHPKNSDYLLFKANILRWQKENLKAIEVLNHARKITPNYFEVWALQLHLLKLEYTKSNKPKVDKFYQDFKKVFPKKNIPELTSPKPTKDSFIISTVQYDFLSNNYENGKNLTLAYGGLWKKYHYVVNMNASNQFNISDQQISSAMTTKINASIWLSGGISASNHRTLYPAYSIYIKSDYLSQNQWLGSYQLSHKSYETITVDSNQFSISKRWNNFEPRIALFITTIDYNDVTMSALTQLTYNFRNSHTLRLSFSAGNELEYVNASTIIYDIKNITIDGKYRVNRAWHIIYAISHHIQGTAYTKNGILSGLQYKF